MSDVFELGDVTSSEFIGRPVRERQYLVEFCGSMTIAVAPQGVLVPDAGQHLLDPGLERRRDRQPERS